VADQTLDTKGLNCPLPILKAKKAMKDVPLDGTLEVLTTDPGAVDDFSSFCKATGHTLVSKSETDGVFTFVLKNTA
jgi:tRNA 2-thiouridine synthesizing protein A